MFTYTPRGVCSAKMHVTIDDNKRIEHIRVDGGCNGNLTGLATLCIGQDAASVIEKLRGIRCGDKPTSCPDQLTYAIEGALRDKFGHEVLSKGTQTA